MRVLFFLLWFCLELFSLTLEDNRTTYLDFPVDVYIDQSGRLGVDEISKAVFLPQQGSTFAYGKITGSLWFRLKLDNQSNQSNFVVSLGESFYKKANFYCRVSDGWQVEQSGLDIPMSKREIKDNTIAFGVTLPQGEVQTCYIELQGLYNYFGHIRIYEQSVFYRDSKFGIDSFYFFTFGLFLIISFFNLLLFVKLKEKIYLYYFGYVFFYLFYLVCISGVTLYFEAELTHWVMMATGFAIVFLILFSREYLETHHYTPKLDRLLRLLSLGVGLMGVLSLVWFHPWNKIISLVSLLVFALLIINALMVYQKRNSRQSLVYLIVLILYLVALIAFFLMLSSVLPYNDLTRYGYLVAAVAEISAFSIMLAGRYHAMRDETIRAQNALITIKNRTQEELEKMVAQKTDELSSVNLHLKKLVDERELLLKEVFHRVKNNFQIIIGLLWFRQKQVPQQKEAYLELISHIKSMSAIHELLYQAEDVSVVNVPVYLGKIIRLIQAQYPGGKMTIKATLPSALDLSFNDAMSLGVILNEVLQNAIKHHHGLTPCVIHVGLEAQDKACVLQVEDNGRGFDGIVQDGEGFGLRLIKQFSGKLKRGGFKYTVQNGTCFELFFVPSD